MNSQFDSEKTVTVTITFKTTPGFTRMRFGDCYGDVNTDSGKRIGGVGGTIGGAYQVDIDGDEYMVSPRDVFNAVCAAFGKTEYMLK